MILLAQAAGAAPVFDFERLVRSLEGVSPYLLAIAFVGLVWTVIILWRQNQKLWASRVEDLHEAEKTQRQVAACLSRMTRALAIRPCFLRRDPLELNGLNGEGEEK